MGPRRGWWWGSGVAARGVSATAEQGKVLAANGWNFDWDASDAIFYYTVVSNLLI